MEVIIKNPFKVIVDYAHTPDALEKAYRSARGEGRMIILLFVGIAIGIGLGYSIGYSRGEKRIPSRLLKYVQDKQDIMLDEAMWGRRCLK